MKILKKIMGNNLFLDNDQIQKHIICAECSSSTTNTSSGVNVNDFTILPISSIYTTGTKLTISSNKIVIGAGVTHVKISAQIYGTTPISSGDLLRMCVVKNGNSILTRAYNRVGGAYVMIGLPTKVVPVIEGDYLELRFNNGTRTGTEVSSGSNSYVTVEVI